MDFLPYRKGVNIADQMSMPAGAAADKYETTFIYEKNGTRKEFTLDNYPSDDSSWKFIDQKSVMVEKGYTPPIHDFSIKSSYGDDLTTKILSHEGYSVFMIVKKLESANMKRLQKGFDLGSACMNNAIDFYVLTASGADEIRKFENGLQFCNVDETTLKTMVRSDPGYMVIKDGMILEKWSWATMPEKDRVVQLYAK
jgi:triosephosphate isomerase